MEKPNSFTGTLVEIDQRGRVSLGKLGVSGLFLASQTSDGAVLLEPATVVTELERRLHANPELHADVVASRADFGNAKPR